MLAQQRRIDDGTGRQRIGGGKRVFRRPRIEAGLEVLDQVEELAGPDVIEPGACDVGAPPPCREEDVAAPDGDRRSGRRGIDPLDVRAVDVDTGERRHVLTDRLDRRGKRPEGRDVAGGTPSRARRAVTWKIVFGPPDMRASVRCGRRTTSDGRASSPGRAGRSARRRARGRRATGTAQTGRAPARRLPLNARSTEEPPQCPARGHDSGPPGRRRSGSIAATRTRARSSNVCRSSTAARARAARSARSSGWARYRSTSCRRWVRSR